MRFQLKILILALFGFCQMMNADVKLNSIFSDHMVIQQQVDMPIWGWGNPNEKIEIAGSWGGSSIAIADENGSWKTYLKTPKAGGPFTITITGKNKIVLNDVLSGEVWLCTGQSNMDFRLQQLLKDSKNPKYQPVVERLRKEVTNANDDWLRHIEVSRKTSLYDKQKDFEGKWISAVKDEVKKITATGYFFAKELREKLGVPIGLVECSWGGTRVQPWISEKAYTSNEKLKEFFNLGRKEAQNTIAVMDADTYVDKAYQHKIAKWMQNGEKGRKPKPKSHPNLDNTLPATLYNGMLSSVIPYAIKGAIWYQGESNAVYMPNQYKDFFTTMVTGWRDDWNQGDFPFYWVQLAACKRGDKKTDEGWATVNDQLRKSLELKNTGMAVLHDIGEANDIHPHNKMDVGKRLSYWALSKDYNIKVDAVSGPLYKSFKIEGNKIYVEFSEVEHGLMVANKHLTEKAIQVDEELKWFEIQDSEGNWHQAEAKIISKNKIEVWSKKISSPANVRYAWSANPEGANLYNQQGLPAAVFSSEEK